MLFQQQAFDNNPQQWPTKGALRPSPRIRRFERMLGGKRSIMVSLPGTFEPT
jgi:hypothetical protein